MREVKFQNIYLRGKLSSCNYTCAYCPFAKRKFLQAELDADIQLFADYRKFIEEQINPVRLMVLPYGEGLIHKAYLQGYMNLAKLENVVGISCQTNLSFSVESFIQLAKELNVPLAKLKLWASFHPSMVGMDVFVQKTNELYRQGIELCVGAVGNPANIAELQQLKSKLNPNIYMFINAMQGLGRILTKEEIHTFSSIDNLFIHDLYNAQAVFSACSGGKQTVFIDEKKQLFACPRSGVSFGNIQDVTYNTPVCHRKTCDCYIAYSNLPNSILNQMMGEGAIWRIPEKKEIEAIFFDIDGTITDGTTDNIPKSYQKTIPVLAEKFPLYLATALPYKYAKAKLKHLMQYFKGGVFADGAHLFIEGKFEEYISCPPPSIGGLKLKKYAEYLSPDNRIYKYVFIASESFPQNMIDELKEEYNVFHEKALLTLVTKEANKASGVKKICKQLSITTEKVLAVGNSIHDRAMLEASGYSCAVLSADTELKEIADYCLNPDSLPMFFR